MPSLGQVLQHIVEGFGLIEADLAHGDILKVEQRFDRLM